MSFIGMCQTRATLVMCLALAPGERSKKTLDVRGIVRFADSIRITTASSISREHYRIGFYFISWH